MEERDERAAWLILKDGIFSIAHDLTKIHDGRLILLTGSTSYTNRAITDNGLVRPKLKNKLKKEGSKKEVFFRVGGGLNPPHSSNQGPYQDSPDTRLLPAMGDRDDILVGSALGNSIIGRVGYSGGGGPQYAGAGWPAERGRGGGMARGVGRAAFPNAAWAAKRVAAAPKVYARQERGRGNRGGWARGGGWGRPPGRNDHDGGGNAQGNREQWGNND